ncbi:MAG: FTR1 family iron permease [Clostridia bacterium]|nr:FTR1 family iron permease [Clostridia bacterium]
MVKKIADKAFYILLALAVLGAILFPLLPVVSSEDAYAASAQTKGNAPGIVYYRNYAIYEKDVNPNGETPVRFSDVAGQIKNLFAEAKYRYEKYLNEDYTVMYYDTPTGDMEKTLSPEEVRSRVDNMLELAQHTFYQDSYFDLAVTKYVSSEQNDAFVEKLAALRTLVRDETPYDDFVAAVTDVETALLSAAATLDAFDNLTVTVNDAEATAPHTYYTPPMSIDEEYFLTFDEFKKAADAAGVKTITYTEVAKQIGNLLQEGVRRYEAGENNYYECFSNAYGFWYESSGFEKKVMAYISGARVTAVELQFAKVKEAAGSGRGTDNSVEHIQQQVDALKAMLQTDGKKLDDLLGLSSSSGGGSSLAWATFLGCFTILVREGLEAILIVGAMVAYLVKANEKSKVKYIYIGAAVALVASALLAWLLYSLSWTGVPQEIIEGVTALIAVAVLIYVSNWMISKAESDSWTKYIAGKVSGSVGKGKVWALAFTSFLAVFREGAEVILFYQPLVTSASDVQNGGWAIAGGIAAGILVVAVVFVLIRVFGVKIPLKPFFMATSILMAFMSIVFLGSGIWELFIDGGLWPVGIISGIEGWAENEVLNFFGIYPTWLTLIPQMVLLVVTVVTFILWIRKGKKGKTATEAQAVPAEDTSDGTDDSTPAEGEQ